MSDHGKKIRMIVSSKMLFNFQGSARFECAGILDKNCYFTINGQHVGVAKERFEPFEVEAARMKRLAWTCHALQEQPVTLVWDGERFTLEHFVI